MTSQELRAVLLAAVGGPVAEVAAEEVPGRLRVLFRLKPWARHRRCTSPALRSATRELLARTAPGVVVEIQIR